MSWPAARTLGAIISALVLAAGGGGCRRSGHTARDSGSRQSVGTVTTIQLSGAKELARVPVGRGAHHLTLSPDGRRLWIAIAESARTIVILDTTNPARPRLVRRFDPGFPVHDVPFSPNGRAAWLSAASGPDVTAPDARSLKVLFRVPVGSPPQHIAFDRAYAYLTSGYSGTLEQIDTASGRILARSRSPYGSFELDAAEGYVATSSLLRGTLAIYETRLRLRRIVQLASATRDLAIINQRPSDPHRNPSERPRLLEPTIRVTDMRRG
jgi:DNA-binding beta-propeller fold protein YncE